MIQRFNVLITWNWHSGYLSNSIRIISLFNDIDMNRAMEMNKRILDQYPDDIRFLKLKGIRLFEEGKYGEALILF